MDKQEYLEKALNKIGGVDVTPFTDSFHVGFHVETCSPKATIGEKFTLFADNRNDFADNRNDWMIQDERFISEPMPFEKLVKQLVNYIVSLRLEALDNECTKEVVPF